jgi:hypothetical protein
MVIPVGLPQAQQLVVVNKDVSGNVSTKEIMRVLFSLLARTGRSRPAIPIDCDQPLRLIATTDSGRSRPACGRR